MSQMLVVISCCIKFVMMRVLELQLATWPFQRFDVSKDWGDGLVVVVGEVKEDNLFDLQRPWGDLGNDDVCKKFLDFSLGMVI